MRASWVVRHRDNGAHVRVVPVVRFAIASHDCNTRPIDRESRLPARSASTRTEAPGRHRVRHFLPPAAHRQRFVVVVFVVTIRRRRRHGHAVTITLTTTMQMMMMADAAAAATMDRRGGGRMIDTNRLRKSMQPARRRRHSAAARRRGSVVGVCGPSGRSDATVMLFRLLLLDLTALPAQQVHRLAGLGDAAHPRRPRARLFHRRVVEISVDLCTIRK